MSSPDQLLLATLKRPVCVGEEERGEGVTARSGAELAFIGAVQDRFLAHSLCRSV